MNIPVNIDSFSGGEEKKAKIVMMKYGDKKYFGFIDMEVSKIRDSAVAV